MIIKNFDALLAYDLKSAADLLLISITTKNELKYKKYDALIEEYMDKVGSFEQQVIYSDLEVQMKKRTEQMIISAKNRREEPDIEKIAETVKSEFQQKLDRLSSSPSKHSLPELTDEQRNTMKIHYQELVKVLHPELNPDETESDRELYEKVIESYRNDDYQAIEIAYSAVFPEHISVRFKSSNEQTMDEKEAETKKHIEEYKRYSAADFTLVRKIFPCFRADSEQLAMIEKTKEYVRKTSEENEKIEKIKNSFPFTAETMLRDKNLTEEYLDKLRKRLEKNTYEKNEIEKRINALLV